jgi:hypothetical protein
MVVTVGDDVLGCYFQGPVYFQIWKLRLCQIKNSKKLGKNQGKKRGEWCSPLVMMFGGAVFRVQYAFPNMESEAVPHEK